MQPNTPLSKASSVIQLKLRSIINGQSSTYPTLTFRVKSLRPLQIEDATGLILSSQNDAPRSVAIGIYPSYKLR
jgi:hypothetical protein